ncbi:acyl-phosphate glycerol 3-phosphate acyltransferase [Arachidicoccus ginsenosidimutans]|uniref:glycerol-3-phosphate 1-O-acyltransferase PlsY n=1 Tax=Arachidicoccus sp. BS20 TaxID=1850526 RepID=UPI0007F10077|nr:glycerol-3-phosphate 1-O-acyltransferase PlsY [Arachidicoccus sp. BS20]ANI89196.1 acyl-phosphate glycerol 3-phosphate acyltransferase [Arachidicoccus sp. BS20]
MQELLLLIIAYLLGSIPTSVWVSKHFFGIDIRDYGSGNAGATNTFRVLGQKWGIFVMAVDIAKGAAAGLLVFTLQKYASHDTLQRTNLMIGLGLAAVLGHIFPIFANFKGGKGVATLFGAIIALQPAVAGCCVGVFLLVLYLTRFVSLSSIFSGIAFAVLILFIFNDNSTFYRIFSIAVALMLVLTHQKNINRLLKGTENKVPILKFRDKRKRRKRKNTDE